MDWPLKGITVLDFSQFLAGPYASLRLLDLGARVIKIENPDGGDLCRRHYLSDTRIDGDSTLFHAINRGKESVALDLKSRKGRAVARDLIAGADVVIQNFRPGVIARLDLDFEAVRRIRPDIVYGSVSGYGDVGDWAELPGQDLLAQARSGIMWLSGNEGAGPVPIGLPIADIAAGATLATGLLGALVRQARTGQGGLVETSLLEAAADMQFEFLTTYLNNGRKRPARLPRGSAHGYLGAPYGVFETSDGHLALAMSPLARLSELLGLADLGEGAADPGAGFDRRVSIHDGIARALKRRSAAEWEEALTPEGIWCARVLTWDEMLASSSFDALELVSHVLDNRGKARSHMAAPFRLDGQRAGASRPAPKLDADGPRLRGGSAG
ncbi:CaiB/BaiF CoA transferase family protein [Jannaschia marina]|uniref:CaiB/BaiF CoA transferase family protein n=1 Tax=Jannaschia marina TaxID=2741674 RepID=UPI0015CE30AC|nr:CaiB/BaiF CoA-transferase family protein [Jannaschia marina]